MHSNKILKESTRKEAASLGGTARTASKLGLDDIRGEWGTDNNVETMDSSLTLYIQANQSEKAAPIDAIVTERSYTAQGFAQTVNGKQALGKQEFQLTIKAKKQEIQGIKDRQQQDVFGSSVDAIDAFMTRKERMQRYSR